MKGARGLIKVGYQVAAEVSDFVIVLRDGTLTGTVTRSDPYLLTQRPMTFVVPTKTGAIRWPLVRLIVTATTVSATLGPALED